MLTAGGPNVVEFNVRLGDPEAQVVLPLITSDLSSLLMSAAAGELHSEKVSVGGERRVGVVLASADIPTRTKRTKSIHGLDAAKRCPM